MDYYYCKSNGLCVMCYSPLSEADKKNYCVRCKSCRERMSAEAQSEKKKKEERWQQAMNERLGKCLGCEFMTDAGGVLYCPSAKGTCLKKEMSHEDCTDDYSAADDVVCAEQDGLKEDTNA